MTEAIPGARFGRLTVLGVAPGRYRVYVRCDCGVEKSIYRYSLTEGIVQSCGCIRRKLPCDAGYRFGHLAVLGEAPNGPNGLRYVWVKCDCGSAVKRVQPDKLVKGETLSCGCLGRQQRMTHGMGYHRHPTYTAWQNMHTRCTNPNITQFKDWGGRGITICERWQRFEDFYADMGPSWRKGLTLDRVDNNGNYEHGNCRWTTRLVQNNNRRPPNQEWRKGTKSSLTSEP